MVKVRNTDGFLRSLPFGNLKSLPFGNVRHNQKNNEETEISENEEEVKVIGETPFSSYKYRV